MTNLRRLLPSFRGLVAFEAAGRLSSFTRAGEELGMTQSAVSYSIKALEEEIGQPLFQRGHREVRLTRAGDRLHAEVTRGLYLLADGIGAVRTRPADDVVTVSVSTAFATLWIAPRLQLLRTDLADIELRLHTADRDLDIVAEEIPLGIRGGRPKDWPGYACARFETEEIIAVASPAYLEKHGTPEQPRDLLSHHLAHLDEPYRYAATWKDWLRSAGVPGADKVRGSRANEYVAVVQMALDGDAVALGWRHLVEAFIDNGRLRKVTGHTFRTGNGYYVVWPKDKDLDDNARAVRDWMLSQNLTEDNSNSFRHLNVVQDGSSPSR
ncbi:LysR substrate-binding domain-containing protein [Labrenzia sp. VG12]|uniref:LysR substrate-binding domain-containing protein n=1 Tax=Labrenzia sp. VG12 TaxID=2021862 RepID=UPI000B8BF166|nr:LysR substrate-binding domain-containing protein [Labrenzia sp. VG12]ASP33517.1 LysR family transcriptional regulator [Labrenzia sp. VG12]